MTHYRICGYDIPLVDPSGPYRLVVVFTHGRELVQAQGYNPAAVRAAERGVARNPRVIERIELRDDEGPLETLWSRTWGES